MTKHSDPPIIPLFLTDEKKQSIQAELKEIEQRELPTIRRRLAMAYEDGDIPENNPFITAHEDLQKAMKRRNELRALLVRAKLYTPHKEHGLIHLGSTISLKFRTGITQVFTLVESEEANPIKGKLSIDSPIGKALLGKKTGVRVEITTPAGKETVEILP